MDGGSVLPILALDIKPGHRVLDMCASPGGKSLLAIQTLYPECVVSNDVSKSRLDRIESVYKQFLYDFEDKWLDSEKIKLTKTDARYIIEDNFDRILVDVPCTVDRHSLRENDNNIFKPSRNKERLQIPELQKELLFHALKLVRKGGVVVYSTCSLSPIQNDGVVHMALKQIWEETKMEIVVKDLSPALLQTRSVYEFADSNLLRYGHLVVPSASQNYGPTYFCKLEKVNFLMETPTLTKKQQKSTLSTKRNKSKETIKNALASSFNNFFWPKISSDDEEAVGRVLKNNLPRIKENQVNVPWRELKNIPKVDRKKFREDYIKNITGQVINKKESDGLCFGVNDVTKLLENNNADAVLISGDVHPIIMVQHLIDLAVLYRTPVLVIDNLRNLLKDHTGISSLVLGIHKKTSKSSLSSMKKTIYDLFEKFPCPKNHINYNRSIKKQINEKMDSSSNVKTVEPYIKICDDKIRAEVHLKRENKQKRVFVPLIIEEVKQSPKMQIDETDFIAFSDEPIEKKVVKPLYKSLIVKRLKGDSNRNKRKIDTLKKNH
ncbi:hypothetical protein JTB14_036947 [Gonioctena quinquepunctata]|nr:hypothetical protein JTB14_036947 [Gonioctena quinquepunctata]